MKSRLPPTPKMRICKICQSCISSVLESYNSILWLLLVADVVVGVVDSCVEELAPPIFAVERRRLDRQVSERMHAPQSVSLSRIAFAWDCMCWSKKERWNNCDSIQLLNTWKRKINFIENHRRHGSVFFCA